MKHLAHIHMAVTAIATALMCMLVPMPVQANSGTFTWIDDIHGAIVFYKGDARYTKEYPQANWDLYLEQIQAVRAMYDNGDSAGTYAAMNRFMDMLEVREGGIPITAANELFNFCNLVTPSPFHDVIRHSGAPKLEQPRMPEKGRRELLGRPRSSEREDGRQGRPRETEG